jgi:hypothetical protein
VTSDSSKPPGFNGAIFIDEAEKELVGEGESIASVKDFSNKGGYIFNDINRVIELGNVMGYNMEGTSGDLQTLMQRMSVKTVDK